MTLAVQSSNQSFSAEDVSKHGSEESLWVIIDENVFDLTKFQSEHPGGKKILKRVAGQDASKMFWKYHNAAILKKYTPRLQIGYIGGSGQSNAAPASAPSAAVKPVPKAVSKPSSAPKEEQERPTATASEPYGDLIPYGDPSWYQGYVSPYYNETHVALREEVRAWVENDLEPNVEEWETKKDVPPEIYKELGRRGYLAGALGIHYPTEYTDIRPASVPVEKWDHFHEFILTDEICRAGSGGLVWNLLGGYGIGCPPVAKFATPQVKKRVLPELLSGEKRICLCITEPDAGSDVANITTVAKKSDDGTHYIVNGEKKWITNGIWSDYFTVAVRTGGPGMNGISLLLLEKTMPGVNVRRMDCMGMFSSGTTYVSFEDVKVPVENLLGKENQGFKVIMTNFNHERLGIIIQANRFSRVCYEESVKYAHKRKTFGKPLIEHPVIRMKLANMAIRIEATHNWLENILYQTNNMSEREAMLRLGGAIAGLKAQATQTFEMCAREAAQVFGGLSYSRGGQGGKVERLYREVRAYSIPGGSEEIMLDLSIRQALRVHQMLGAKI
ncbi:acyl-CoA dehydrogenase/oxidase [Lipomyces oligophaga]|uniref:acyl-CoA dehydrogenase/oxidase n=1 Tax=Lipomyces oligophaga TaxID=45792 RepID=UPI0034CE305F